MQITQSQEFILTQALTTVAACTEAAVRANGVTAYTTPSDQALVEAQRTALDLAVWIVADDACPENLSTTAHRVSSGRTVPFPEKGYWSSNAQASWDELAREEQGLDPERYLDVRAQLVVRAEEGDITTNVRGGKYTQWTADRFTHVEVTVDIDNEWAAFSVVRPLGDDDDAFDVERLIKA